SAHTHESLAAALGLAPAGMLKALYKRKGYTVWLIPKKNGQHRTIASPSRLRRHIQIQLKAVLEQVYKPDASVHGFLQGHSIVTNAKPHVRRRTIINLDIKDCFGSISFFRVRGLLLKAPFNLPWVTANILAQATTFENALPPGGITSPILANIVMAGLDKRLSRMMIRYGGRYTRYADDLTFSFPAPPGRLGEFVEKSAVGNYQIAPKLSAVLKEEGFESNQLKFRCLTGASSKRVTGLKVSDKVNLPRRWIRELDCKIYAMEKFGVNAVAAADHPDSPVEAAKARLLRHIHGKIAFASMVRGRADFITAAMANRLNQLHERSDLYLSDIEIISRGDRASRAVWVVTAAPEGEDHYFAPEGNGTAFCIRGGLLVTAAHVIEDHEGKTKAPYPVVCVRRADQPGTYLGCNVIAFDRDRDLAVLQLLVPRPDLTRFQFALGKVPVTDESMTSIGFPNYVVGNRSATEVHVVQDVRPRYGVLRIRATGNIMGGASGGPLLNKKFEVAGITHKGLLMKWEANEFISVGELRTVLNEIK
ncbi:hypothetical protein KCV01_g1268, partial [Aureobasidium melanogenum]